MANDNASIKPNQRTTKTQVKRQEKKKKNKRYRLLEQANRRRAVEREGNVTKPKSLSTT